MKEIYAVVNDNSGNVKDRVEFLFLNKEKAERYAEEMNNQYGKYTRYWVETLYLLEEDN